MSNIKAKHQTKLYIDRVTGFSKFNNAFIFRVKRSKKKLHIPEDLNLNVKILHSDKAVVINIADIVLKTTL